MTRDEFSIWWDFHQAHFPGLGVWLARIPEQLRPETMAAWYKVLEHTNATDAHDASGQLFADGDNAPRSYEKHPQAIAAIARRLRAARLPAAPMPKYHDGQEVFRCLKCQDNGTRTVWGGKAHAAARDGTLGERFTLYQACCACTCSAGDYWADRCRLRLPRFNPKTMLECQYMDADEQAALITFVGTPNF